MRWITAQDITTWARTKQRDCQGKFPWLIGSLIRATAAEISDFDFPSVDNVALQGWDGRLDCTSTCPFVPNGVSGWEFGTTGSSVKGKADEDFDKRTDDPIGLDKGQTSFVFVTPRPWPQRRKWSEEKKAAGTWKEVRVIGAVELEEWLTLAPAVAADLARHIGKYAGDVESVQGFSESWLAATTTPIYAEILLAGRKTQADRIRNWATGAADILEIKGVPAAEGTAFLWACFDRADVSLRQKSLSRSVITKDEAALKSAILCPTPLIILTPAPLADLAGEAVQHGHHVCVVGSPDMTVGDHALRLPRSSRKNFVEALVNSNVSEDEATRIAKATGSGIPELKRYWARTGAQRTPQWAAVDHAPNVVPAVLLGGWSGRNDVGDREIIERLTGRPLAEWQDSLRVFSTGEDVLIQSVGDVWQLIARADALACCAGHIDRDRMSAFADAAVEVLTEVHPKYELDTDKRYAHSIYGADRKYSGWLRKAIAETVCLVGARGDGIGLDPGLQPNAWANGVVRRIFDKAETWQAWSSLDSVMPFLAEAGPDAFLSAVETRLDADPDLFVELMRDDGIGFGTECRHATLLWALETLAWFPEYITPATRLLARLVQLDPGGQYANRPQGSLSDIFTIQPIHTAASPDEKLAAMDVLIANHPEQAWNVLHNYAVGRGITSGTAEPVWRPLETSHSSEDIRAYANGLLDRYVTLILADATRLAEFVQEGFRLAGEARDQIAGKLRDTDFSEWAEEDRGVLFHGIRKRLHHLRSYEEPGEDRDAEIELLERTFSLVVPASTINRFSWLFDENPPALPEGEKRDYQKYYRSVEQKRDEAAPAIFEAVGADGISDFCEKLKYPESFAQALGRRVPGDSDRAVTDALLKSIEDTRPYIVQAYASARIEAAGQDWLSEAIQALESDPEKTKKSAALCLGLRQELGAWAHIDELGEEVAAQYWTWVGAWPQERTAEAVAFAINRLLEAGRPLSAVDIADLAETPLPPETVLSILKATVSTEYAPHELGNQAMLGYHIERLFNRLDETAICPDAEVAALEWPLFKLLKDSERGPRAIYETLRQNPGNFALLVGWVFKPDVEERPEREEDDGGLSEEQRKNRAENAYEVLSSWNIPPGVENGEVDSDALMEWVDEARRLCRESGRSYGGDYFITQLLVHVPPHWKNAGADEVWPHPSVQAVIEKHGNPKFDKEFGVAVHNSRGTVWRGRGGDQEREIAEKFTSWADAVPKTSWRTVQILRAIARSYEADARWHDERQELDDMRYD